MTANKFIKKLLRLKALRVKRYIFKERKKEIHLWVKPDKNGCRCPKCNRRCPIYRIMPKARGWRDLSICGNTVWFWYAPKEILCPTHGRIQERIPWADAFSRVTYRFEYVMFLYGQMMTQKAAARLLNISPKTFSDLLHRAINRLREGHRIRNLKSIGVDEISYRKGHLYATIVYELDNACVVWVGKGKGRETIDTFFNQKLSAYQKQHIQLASCDMSETYINAIEQHCPNAILVLDRFHIVKALNEAVDHVRKEQWRKASVHQRKALKGLRWILFRHSSNRSDEHTRTLKNLSKGNRRIYRASVLKDEFDLLWDFTNIEKAREFLKAWFTTALKSRLEPIRKFVHTIRSHMERILPFVETHLTNAKAEGINRIIKIVKNRASGFRNLEAFSDLIFLTVGDLDLPDQIPSDFRTL